MWFRFRTLAIIMSALVLIAVVGLFLWMAPFYKLAQQWESAQATKNISAMEELYCWDGVDVETRQRMHLLLLQEFDYPVKSARVVRWRETDSSEHWRANLQPVAQLNVTFNNPEHFQVSFMIGRTEAGACKLAIMVPKP
jgi:hypothetical protein